MTDVFIDHQIPMFIGILLYTLYSCRNQMNKLYSDTDSNLFILLIIKVYWWHDLANELVYCSNGKFIEKLALQRI